MGQKKCKKAKKEDFDSNIQEDKKYKCKKCNLTSNKEKKLCKPEKQ